MLKLIFGVLCIVSFTSFHNSASNECDIEAFYSGITPSDGTMALTSGDDLQEVTLLLVPMNIDKGKYVVNITRKGSNLYKIDGKNITFKLNTVTNIRMVRK